MLTFVIAALVIELTPGPNMTWLAITGTTRGRPTALAAVAGIGLGLSFAGIVAALGLAAVIAKTPWMFQSLRWAGSLYLLYLAWDAWRDSAIPPTQGGSSAGKAFLQGLLSNCLNPKAYIFYAAILPQFIDPTQALAGQLFLLTAIYVAIATGIHAAIAIASGSLTDWLGRTPRAVLVRRTLATATATVAVWFFISTGALK